MNNNVDNKKNAGDYYDKIPILHDDGKSKFREQISKGFGALLIIAISILFYFVFLRFTDIYQGFTFLKGILTPLFYGLIIAYLLNPMMKKIEIAYFYLFFNIFSVKKTKKSMEKTARRISISLSVVMFLLLIYFLLNLVVPELYTSIQGLIKILPDQLNAFSKYLAEIEIESDSAVLYYLEDIGNDIWSYLKTWIQTELLTEVNSLMSNVTIGVMFIITWIVDVFMGIVLAIYLLLNKELFLRQSKKAIYAILPVRGANISLHIFKKSNTIFGGFIIGKILDSMIIGIITFFFLGFLNMPYVMLISVIVGVTNVIPYFGPFIGGIPCALLVLLADPMQGVYFLIYILVIQQIDGNIIGPKILGDSTGLSPFWVIIAVMLGSGFFGFIGMLIGVPSFAVLYYVVGLFINQKLERKNLPVSSMGYSEMSYVDDQTGEFVPSKEDMEEEFEETEEKSENAEKENLEESSTEDEK